MDDNLLFRISLSASLIGIIAIFIISYSSDIEIVTPTTVNDTQDNLDFYLIGNVENIRENDKAASIVIGEIQIVSVDTVYFKKKNESTGIKKGDDVKLRASKYNGRIIVNEIK